MLTRAGIMTVGAALSLLIASPSAPAYDDDDVATGGSGVLTGNVVQIPVTATVPIQVCNNDVAVGVGGVAGC